MPQIKAERGKGSHHRVRHTDEDEVEDGVVDVDEDGEAEASAGWLKDALEQAWNCAAINIICLEPSQAGFLLSGHLAWFAQDATTADKPCADTCPMRKFQTHRDQAAHRFKVGCVQAHSH